jgi:uncharacterized membrane protein YfcA
MLSIVQYALSAASGFLVGFSLGLVGGGGSILAVPLFLYLVGLGGSDSVHVALGTTALAVGINAYVNSYMHLRRRNIAPRVGVIFAVTGLAGSLLGTRLGYLTPGPRLLLYFAIIMIALGIYMAARRESRAIGDAPVGSRGCRLTPGLVVRVSSLGFLVGLASGYFGIGGGFLIVPTLVFSAGLCINRAIGTSLLSVGTFGVVSGIEYWLYGDVVLSVALLYVLGGVVGGYLGTSLGTRAPRDVLRIAYGAMIVTVGVYMLLTTAP